MHDPRVIVALDYDNKDTALAFVDKLDSSLCKLKVGKDHLIWTRIRKSANR